MTRFAALECIYLRYIQTGQLQSCGQGIKTLVVFCGKETAHSVHLHLLFVCFK